MGVGTAACVAIIPAITVAPTSGGGVGVSVGSAADTAACTVASMSGGSVGVGPPDPKQAAIPIDAMHNNRIAAAFILEMAGNLSLGIDRTRALYFHP